jgi:hypothetical protein
MMIRKNIPLVLHRQGQIIFVTGISQAKATDVSNSRARNDEGKTGILFST